MHETFVVTTKAGFLRRKRFLVRSKDGVLVSIEVDNVEQSIGGIGKPEVWKLAHGGIPEGELIGAEGKRIFYVPKNVTGRVIHEASSTPPIVSVRKHD
ncbi:MAG: hypothetical protein KKD17_07050 [Nanoarchaeota archaeon]|nr:hypothetical protein [Nanoarchaeota archaeon]